MLFFRQRLLAGAALALLTLCATASEAVAKPKPGRGFRLFASAENIFTVNRVQCRVFSTGQICATGSSTVGGGIWPRGTANQFVFASGINIAGIIEPGDRSVNGFAGDTAGAFFNNTGGSDNSEEIRPIFDSNDAADAAVWPDEARVPCAEGTTAPNCLELALGSDPQGALFDPGAAGLDRRVAGRSLVPQLGRQPHPPRVPQPPHGRGRRDPGAGLELPPGERRHHLLPLHLLQHHQHQRGRLRGGPARASVDPAGEGRGVPVGSERQVRREPAGRGVRHQRPVRRVRGRHGRGPGGRQLRHGERAVRARRHVREHLQHLSRARLHVPGRHLRLGAVLPRHRLRGRQVPRQPR